MRTPKTLLVVLLALTTLSGCLGGGDGGDEATLPDGITSVFERNLLPFDVAGNWSMPLRLGSFGILDGFDLYVDVPLPPGEGGAAINPVDLPRAHMGVFLPDIPGCDWDTWIGTIDDVGFMANTPDFPEECRVPVIADIGPYWTNPHDSSQTEGDVAATQRDSRRLGEFLISNFVPHGYAVAQVSVMGSGLSNHCFDMFGLAEQLGVHHSVEALGKAPWSNGNVGLIGRSYDGSTPWMAAAHGSEHLKTIVPISGLSGLLDLVTWNGASEQRILTFHNQIYGQFGIHSHEQGSDLATHATCPDWVTAAPMGAAAYLKGDSVVDLMGNTYWEKRATFIPDAVQNYRGSLYMIHGLVDNNVDPHAGWMGQLELQDAGLEVKSMWGQWGHNYPDRPNEHGDPEPRASVRFDWAQDLLEWFDHYLKGTGPKPLLHHEIQQRDGAWRVESEFPPSDATFLDVPLGSGTVQVLPANPGGMADLGVPVIDLGVLSPDHDLLMGGLSSITLQVTPTGPGGQIYVHLRNSTGSGFGLSYGIMELRHATGEFQPVAAGIPMTIEIPFQLFDAVLPAGESLHLFIAGTGNNFMPGPVASPVLVDLAGSTLHLSTLERGPQHYFQPPQWLDDDGERLS